MLITNGDLQDGEHGLDAEQHALAPHQRLADQRAEAPALYQVSWCAHVSWRMGTSAGQDAHVSWRWRKLAGACARELARVLVTSLAHVCVSRQHAHVHACVSRARACTRACRASRRGCLGLATRHQLVSSHTPPWMKRANTWTMTMYIEAKINC
jgi:hypothetical protein